MFKQLETAGVLIGDKIYHPKVIHVALAQIEEAGDISGLPVVENNTEGRVQTSYAPPAWWPTEKDATGPDGKPCPVILLIDDFNRADPRILKAIMQVLQDGGTNTAKLPEWCTIGLTGNPPTDDQDMYMVNEIDKAIKTRMLHIEMKFSKEDWAHWAQRTGVDGRVISFALAYPEQIDGTKGLRTNPRSIADFAYLIEDIQDLKAEAHLVGTLARSCLDESVAVSFEKFMIGGLQHVVEPAEILNSWATAEKKLEKLAKRNAESGEKLRADIVGIICNRLFVYLLQPGLKLEKKQHQNFLEFISAENSKGQLKYLPEDAMYTLLRRLRRDAVGDQEKLITDMIRYGGKKISDLIMGLV